MPINIGITFLVGGVLGWIVVKILGPPRHLEGLVIATSSAGKSSISRICKCTYVLVLLQDLGLISYDTVSLQVTWAICS